MLLQVLRSNMANFPNFLNEYYVKREKKKDNRKTWEKY